MQVQLLNTVEHPGPIIPFLNYDNDGLRGTKGQRTGVLRRRIIRVRKSLLPRLEVGEIPERDLAKKVCSGARNPRFRDDAAPLERFWLVVKEVDDVVRDFWWEAQVRHRGSSEGGKPPGVGASFELLISS